MNFDFSSLNDLGELYKFFNVINTFIWIKFHWIKQIIINLTIKWINYARTDTEDKKIDWIIFFVEALAKAFRVLPSESDWSFSEPPHRSYELAYFVIALLYPSSPFNWWHPLIDLLGLQDLLFEILNCLYLFPCLSFFVQLGELFSFRKRSMIRTEFGRIGWSEC